MGLLELDTRMTIQEVTPEQARYWLRRTRQSAVSFDRVIPLVESMERGEWDIVNIPNDPIVIHNGRLDNGNHRLTAILIHGKPMPLKVIQ